MTPWLSIEAIRSSKNRKVSIPGIRRRILEELRGFFLEIPDLIELELD